jgi:hypothetical protein
LNFYTATKEEAGVKAGRGIVGANWKRKSGREALRVWISLYADDAAAFEPTRHKLQGSLNAIVNAFARFGLKVHLAATPAEKSKTECMVFVPGVAYESVDTSPLQVDRGWASFTRTFTYLGSLVSFDGRDDAAVDARIAKASAVFGALRKELFGDKRIAFRVKAAVWEALVAAVLLFGAECWCLTARARGRLISFQRRCVRAMCRVSRWKVWKNHLTAEVLGERVGVTAVETLYARKALAWLGHLVRMPHTRLCRRIAFAWMDKPRKRGGQMLSWGHTMLHNRGDGGLVKRAGNAADMETRRALGFVGRNGEKKWTTEWYNVARDRVKWKGIIRAINANH